MRFSRASSLISRRRPSLGVVSDTRSSSTAMSSRRSDLDMSSPSTFRRNRCPEHGNVDRCKVGGWANQGQTPSQASPVGGRTATLAAAGGTTSVATRKCRPRSRRPRSNGKAPKQLTYFRNHQRMSRATITRKAKVLASIAHLTFDRGDRISFFGNGAVGSASLGIRRAAGFTRMPEKGPTPVASRIRLAIDLPARRVRMSTGRLGTDMWALRC